MAKDNFKFTFIMEHDAGTANIAIVDTCLVKALGRITDLEQAPQSAIKKTRIRRLKH